MEFTDEELELIKEILDDVSDRMHHHPDDYQDGAHRVFGGVCSKFDAAFKAAGFWWAR